ncbi:hypothetical protein DFQ28_001709 [Apophysomyces sp. BC1034]|nr:hypothetical protein DFQ29_001213 [Apophysomyces sp. BC1021]KAG0190681.1 hypothetical protein DFQ28_001709 [Apophysomyces sp. BC1034]
MTEHTAEAHEPLYNNDVAISPKKDHFRRATVSPQPRRPKIADKTSAILLPVVSIVADQQAVDRANLVAFKQYPTAHSLLVEAMDVLLPPLPRFLWTFENDTSTSSDYATFIKIIQCVLTDFYTLGDHSQLLGFQWCEIPTEVHAEFAIDPTTWKRSISNKFHDGLGYDSNNRSRLIMEGSSTYTDKENVQHSQDDTIKSIHASIELLDSLVRRHLSASFASLCLIKSFSLQCVCTSVTLSTTSLDPEDAGAYIHAQVRSADIPINYNSRASWTAIFELLVYLFTSLREQVSYPTMCVRIIQSISFNK